MFDPSDRPAIGARAPAILAELRRRIADGDWPAGELVPGETELAGEFGVARATMNKVMQMLADQGLVERRRRGGTRVLNYPVRKATLSIPIVREEIEAAGHAYSHRLIAQRSAVLPDDAIARMGTGKGIVAIHLRCLHLADAQPYQLEDRWINPVVIPEALTADFACENPNEWLVRKLPAAQAALEFSAANANAREARLLAVPRGQALLVLQRTTWIDAGPVTDVRLAFHSGYCLKSRV